MVLSFEVSFFAWIGHKGSTARIHWLIDDMNQVSATDPDWSRERPRRFWDPSRQLLRAIRGYQNAKRRSLPVIPQYWVLWHRFWSIVTGADIPLSSQIEGGLSLPHPNGVVIHPGATIGPNCLFFQQVTIAGHVRVGGHVDIGAGAKILGPLTIGDHARVGANAVVTGDVPAHETVVGIPARSTKAPKA